jgi:quercetin dioxygenase-like cupin family protein
MKLLVAIAAVVGGLCAMTTRESIAQHASEHLMLVPSELTWSDLPALPGVKIAVIEGPLSGSGPIMFRLKFPANYKVPPHWHPGVEHITVISGTLNMGMGDAFDAGKTRALTPGSVSIMQPKTSHFVWTSEETIGQVHSIGPWSVTYVNPADDPKNK